jgi:hypothetical protein
MSKFSTWLLIFGLAMAVPQPVFPITATGTYSFQVTPVSGTAPPMANGAGFTTLIVNSDFTLPKYATQSNWLNCNPTGSFSISNPEWHVGWAGFNNAIAGPCSAFTQQTDGANGPALRIHWDDAYCTQNGSFVCFQGVWASSAPIQTVNSDGNGTQIPPNAYFEVVARWSSVPHSWTDLWSYIIDPSAQMEWDGIEVVSFNNDSATREHNHGNVREMSQCANNCTANTCPTCAGDTFPNGIDVSQYHKYSWRVTSDGSTNGYWCAAIDDKPFNCDTWTPNAAQLAGYPTTMQLSAQSDVGNTGLVYDTWIRSVKIYSCSTNSGAKCYNSVPNPPLQ